MTVFKMKQGATFSQGFTWRDVQVDGDGEPIKDADGNYVPGDPIPLTGCSVRMQVRRKIGEPVLITATSENAFSGEGGALDPEAVARGAGRIALETPDDDANPRPGHIQITLTDEDTMKLVTKSAVFDLEVVWPQQADEIRPRVDRPLEGTVEVDLNVTVD